MAIIYVFNKERILVKLLVHFYPMKADLSSAINSVGVASYTAMPSHVIEFENAALAEIAKKNLDRSHGNSINVTRLYEYN